MSTPNFIPSKLLRLHAIPGRAAQLRLNALLVQKAETQKNPLSWTQKAWRFDFELVELYLALNMVEAADELAVKMAELVTENTLATVEIRLFTLMSRVFQAKGQWDEGVEMLNDVLELAREEAQNDANTYRPLVAKTLSQLARLFYHRKDLAMADIFAEEALEKYNKLAASDRDVFQPYVIQTQNDLGVIAAGQQAWNDTEKAFQAELEMAKANASQSMLTSRAHLNLAIFQANIRQDLARAQFHAHASLIACEPSIGSSPEARWYADIASRIYMVAKQLQVQARAQAQAQ